MEAQHVAAVKAFFPVSASDTLRSAAAQYDSVAQDSLVLIPRRTVPAFPAECSELFGGANPYIAAQLADSAAAVGRSARSVVFAARGKIAPYAVRGRFPLLGEVAIPRRDARESAAVGGAMLGVLLSFFLLFILLRRQCSMYHHRYVNLRFFSSTSVRAAVAAVSTSDGFRIVGDVAWPMLVGFLLWRGLWLRWYLRGSDSESLWGLGACMLGFLLLTGIRYLVLGVAEFLSCIADLRWNVWENVQIPTRAFWPVLLMGAVLTVYIVPSFQWHALMAMMGAVGIVWLLRIYRMAKAFYWLRFGRLYFFLYLCGVEIMLPLLSMRLVMVYL